MKRYGELGVIGAGSWGTALACLLAEHGNPVRLWCHTAAVAETIRQTRENTTYLKGIPLPENILPTTDLAALADCGVILLVVPSKVFRSVCEEAAFLNKPGVRWISCTKGIEHDTGKLMTDIMSEVIGTGRVGVLSGPNHAIEVARKIPAAAVIGCREASLAAELQQIFTFPTFRVYTSEDLAGIQLGGALKNVYAIGAGCSDGFSMGDNAKAALVTRSLAEMMRLGTALGGRQETFHGLSGIGDLMVTCFSLHSRNRRFGERLGAGEKPGDIAASTPTVAEGVPTAASAWQQARQAGVETPVLDGVRAVLYDLANPKEIMWQLLGRAPKAERG